MQNTLAKLNFLYTGILNDENDASVCAQEQVKCPGLCQGSHPPETH